MSTQYNKIQKPYDELRKGTVSILERVNIREIILPFIKDANVLDLACGSGHQSRALLQWGASKVVGVDISSAMVEEARVLSTTYGSAATFIVADCGTPTPYPGGPFDIIVAAWLLNYAASEKDMVEMWRNIHLNLKPGGHFVAIMPPPMNDPAGFYDKECRIRPLPTASGGLFSTVNNEVPGGVYIHRHSDTAAGDLDFDAYHLKKDIYESAAKAAGFDRKLEWGGTKVPSDFMQNPQRYGEESSGSAGDTELATYAEVPHYGVLHVVK